MPVPALVSMSQPTSRSPGVHGVLVSLPVRPWLHWPMPRQGYVLFAGSVTHGVFTSHDQGNTWQAASNGLPASSDMNALLYDPTTDTLYAAVDSVGIFASSNLGVSWSRSSKGLPKEVHALTFLCETASTAMDQPSMPAPTRASMPAPTMELPGVSPVPVCGSQFTLWRPTADRTPAGSTRVPRPM